MRRLTMLAVVAVLLTGLVTVGAGFALAAEPQTTGLQQTTATAATADTTAEATDEATTEATAEATEDAEEGTATTEVTAATATTAATTATATTGTGGGAATATTGTGTGGGAATATTGTGGGGTTNRPGQLPTTAGEDNGAVTLVLIAVALGVLGAGLALRRGNSR